MNYRRYRDPDTGRFVPVALALAAPGVYINESVPQLVDVLPEPVIEPVEAVPVPVIEREPEPERLASEPATFPPIWPNPVAEVNRFNTPRIVFVVVGLLLVLAAYLAGR